MLSQLHPYFKYNHSIWWPFLYFLLIGIMVVGVLYLFALLVKRYNANKPVRDSVHLIKSYHKNNADAEFIKITATELFRYTNKANNTSFAYPTLAWLKSVAGDDIRFTTYPYNLLVDVCYKSEDQIPHLTSNERASIMMYAVKRIRSRHV